VRARILEALADGLSRNAHELALEISAAHGFSVFSVGAELSQVANLRNIERRRIGKTYFYRRTDVVDLGEAQA
jgi:hypothetical protein